MRANLGIVDQWRGVEALAGEGWSEDDLWGLGRREAKRMGGGPKPVIRDEVRTALLDMLKEDNRPTPTECRDRLARERGVRVHPWTVGRALLRAGWT